MFHSRMHERLKKYNLTIEQYTSMFTQQEGKCAICHQYETMRDRNGKLRNLSVDHSHTSGKVRSLLCNNCNRSIGIIELMRSREQAIIVLRNMIGYLLKHGV